MRRFLLALPALAVLVAATTTEPLPWDLQLAEPHESGVPLVIDGQVVAGTPPVAVRGAVLELWHQDAQGSYGPTPAQPRIRASVRTNLLGRFRVRTIVPGFGEGAPHVHFELRGTGIATRVGTAGLCRTHGAGSDTTYARIPWMIPVPKGGGFMIVEPADSVGFVARWTLVASRSR